MTAGVYTSGRADIGLLDQCVNIGGSYNASLWCTSITRGHGAGGSRAEFRYPAALFDTDRSMLTDRLVAVWVTDSSGLQGVDPDFLGVLDVDNATLATGADSVSLQASSISGYLNRVWIGQTTHAPIKRYQLLDEITGRPTRWTPKNVLYDLFEHLPSFYGTYIKLGQMDVLTSTAQDSEPALCIRNQTYAQVLDTICAMYGDVVWIERFTATAVYIDFFRMQDCSKPVIPVTCANYQNPVTAGANLASITRNQTSADTITRVIVYGQPRRCIVSTSNALAVSAAKRLISLWDPTLAAAVLLDPKRAKPNAPGYVAGMEHAFTRFVLPHCFRPYKKCKDLVMQQVGVADSEGTSCSKGSTYPIQVWKMPTTLSYDTAGVATGTPSTTPQLLKNVKLDLENNTFQLGCAEDGLNIIAGTIGATGQPIWTWQAAIIGITFAFEPGVWVYGDTGQDSSSNLQLPWKADGLTQEIQRDSLEFLQLTNDGYGIPSADGTNLEFNAIYYNLDANAWSQEYSSAYVLRDDSKAARKLAAEALKTKPLRRVSYDVRVCCFSRAYRPGVQVYLTGTGISEPAMTITSVTHDCGPNQSTSFTCDNVQPPQRHRGHKRGTGIMAPPVQPKPQPIPKPAPPPPPPKAPDPLDELINMAPDDLDRKYGPGPSSARRIMNAIDAKDEDERTAAIQQIKPQDWELAGDAAFGNPEGRQARKEWLRIDTEIAQAEAQDQLARDLKANELKAKQARMQIKHKDMQEQARADKRFRGSEADV